MAKTYNAFLRHMERLTRDLNFTGRFTQKDYNYLYDVYLKNGLESFKESAKKHIRRLKAER